MNTENNIFNSPSLHAFAEDLVNKKGYQNLEEEVRAQLIQDLLVTIHDRLKQSLIEALPENAIEEVSEKIQSGNDQLLQEVFAQHIPNLDEVVAAELIDLGKSYLAL